MNFKFTQNEKKFLGRFVLATGIAWPVGFIVAIVLSYGVVNLFYPKETNLIAGLCLGAAVAYSQRLVIKRYFKISTWWIFAAAIGIGLPFIIEFIFFELSGNKIIIIENDFIDPVIYLFVGGLITGLLQYKIFKSFTSKFRWWIIISPLAWCIGWPINMLGGVINGLITGIAILRLFELPVHAKLKKDK
ncbi:MAG: serine/threonine protein kinase [Bacteroidota bacterium]